MSGLYDVTLANGAAGNIAASGSFVKVSSAPAGAVTLKLDGGEALTLLEGQGLRLPNGKQFRDVQVINKSGSSQTATLFIGDAHFEDTRITGSVRIIDSVGTAVRTDAGSNTANVTFTATAVVAPGSNPNGIIVRAAQTTVKAGAAANAQSWLLAAAAAPVAQTGAQLLWISSAYDQDQQVKQTTNFDMHKLIPAGWGIYYAWANVGAIAAANSYNIGYEIL